MDREYDYLFKIMILGDVVGKTCLYDRLVRDTFSVMTIATGGYDLMRKILMIDGARVKLHMVSSTKTKDTPMH